MNRCSGCHQEIPLSRGGRARKWCSERCRKETLYGGRCMDCGAVTNGSNGRGKAHKRCLSCYSRHAHERRLWTPETVIEAIQAWAHEYGAPPTATEWNPGQHHMKPGAAERYYDGPLVAPPVVAVQREFGSWAAAIEAAGFPRPQVSKYGRVGEDPDHPIVQDAVRSYRAGESACSIAQRLGFSDTAIHYWLRRAGVEMRSQSEAQRLRRERLAA